MEISQEENNRLLLEAIRRKFGAGNDSAAAPTSTAVRSTAPNPKTLVSLKSDTVFNVPAAAKPFTANNESNSSMAPITMDEYLTSESRKQKISAFKIPEFKIPGSVGKPKQPIPILFNLPINSDSLNLTGSLASKKLTQIDKITTKVEKVKIVSDESDNKHDKMESEVVKKPYVIDLTAAIIPKTENELPRPSATQQLLSRTVEQANRETFKIPYIDCNREITTKASPVDHYCTLNVAKLDYAFKMAEPSGIGKILARLSKDNTGKYYTRAATSRDLEHLKMCRHPEYGATLGRFKFDTQSPDDIVKASLEKYKRTSYT